eukprot:scaffold664_cov260-Pinguiococcus_pyrenoidosus.AAC.13
MPSASTTAETGACLTASPRGTASSQPTPSPSQSPCVASCETCCTSNPDNPYTDSVCGSGDQGHDLYQEVGPLRPSVKRGKAWLTWKCLHHRSAWILPARRAPSRITSIGYRRAAPTNASTSASPSRRPPGKKAAVVSLKGASSPSPGSPSKWS